MDSPKTSKKKPSSVRSPDTEDAGSSDKESLQAEGGTEDSQKGATKGTKAGTPKPQDQRPQRRQVSAKEKPRTYERKRTTSQPSRESGAQSQAAGDPGNQGAVGGIKKGSEVAGETSSEQESIEEIEEAPPTPPPPPTPPTPTDVLFRHLGVFSKDMCCVYCCQFFRDVIRIPLVFPCGHNVCSVCIADRSLSFHRCVVCEFDLSRIDLEKLSPNYSLLEIRARIYGDKVKKVVTEKFRKDQGNEPPDDSYYRAVGDIRSSARIDILASLKEVERHVALQRDLVYYTHEMLHEKVRKLQSLNKEFSDALVLARRSIINIAKSKSITDISIGMSLSTDYINPYLEPLAKFREFGFSDSLQIQEMLRTFLKYPTDFHEKISLELSAYMKYCFYVDIKKNNVVVKRLYSQLTMEVVDLHLYCFQRKYPENLSTFMKFQKVKRRVENQRVVFLDLEHISHATEGVNPNRIYILLDKNPSARNLLKYFIGENGECFKGAKVELQGDLLLVKHVIKDGEVKMTREFVDYRVISPKSKIEVGSLIVQDDDKECMYQILKSDILFSPVQSARESSTESSSSDTLTETPTESPTETPTESPTKSLYTESPPESSAESSETTPPPPKNYFIFLGRVCTKLRELHKIKGNCIVRDCGIVLNDLYFDS